MKGKSIPGRGFWGEGGQYMRNLLKANGFKLISILILIWHTSREAFKISGREGVH